MVRLVKFESTKSLASTSSRSIGAALSENGDKDVSSHPSLAFIIEEQQQKCFDFNIEGGAPQQTDAPKQPNPYPQIIDDENYVMLKQLNKQNISYAAEICLVTPLDVEITENCSNIGERAVDICSVSVLEPASETLGTDEMKLKEDGLEKSGAEEMGVIESRIPRLRNLPPSKIPVSPTKVARGPQNGVKDNYNVIRSKIPSKVG